MHDEYLKSLVSQVKDVKETKGSNDLERIITEQELKIKNLEAISEVHQKQNGELQVRIKDLERQIEDKRVDDGGWVSIHALYSGSPQAFLSACSKPELDELAAAATTAPLSPSARVTLRRASAQGACPHGSRSSLLDYRQSFDQLY